MSASKLRFHKKKQESTISTFRHQNRISWYPGNTVKMAWTWKNQQLIDTIPVSPSFKTILLCLSSSLWSALPSKLSRFYSSPSLSQMVFSPVIFSLKPQLTIPLYSSVSKLPLKKPSSLSLNPLTWFHSSHMATQNCDTWQKIELHKSEKNEPQKMGVYTFTLRSFHFFHPYFFFSFFFSFPLTTPSPSSTVTIATAGDMTPAPLSMPSSPLSHSFIFVLFYFICFDFNSKGLGGELMWNFGLFTFGELIWNLNYFFVDKI